MLKPLRQHRKKVLEREGFLPFEARALSRNGLKTPGMVALRKERRQELRQAQKEFVKRVKKEPLRKGIDPVAAFYKLWAGQVKREYIEREWYDKDGNRNPFVRLREIVDALKDQIPNYKTRYTGLSEPKPVKVPGEYKKRAAQSRRYEVTVTYVVEAPTAKEAEDMARVRLQNIKRVNVQEKR